MEAGSIVKCIHNYFNDSLYQLAIKECGLKVPNMVDDYTVEAIGDGHQKLKGHLIVLTLVEIDNSHLDKDKEGFTAFPADHFVELLPPMNVQAIFDNVNEETLVA